MLTYPGVGRWSVGELLAFSGWAGALVYVGALLEESYDLSIAATGLALGFGALVYVPGNLLFRRWVDTYDRRLLVALALSAAVAVTVLVCGTTIRVVQRRGLLRYSASSPAVARSPEAHAGSVSRPSCGWA